MAGRAISPPPLSKSRTARIALEPATLHEAVSVGGPEPIAYSNALSGDLALGAKG
jgi:hypothetical protein